MFIRNAWYVAAWSSEITTRPFARTLLAEAVVLFRRASGLVAAVEDRCCHRGLPLSLGEVRGECIVCGYHGIAYDGDGRCSSIPGQPHVSPRMRVRAFPTHEQDGLIWIWMGAADAADRTTIPPYCYHQDRAEWPHQTCVQHLRCNHRLVIDNLLDLTHLAFVHKATIGGDPDAHARAQFFGCGHAARCPVHPLVVEFSASSHVCGGGEFHGRVDRWMEFEFVAPAVVYQFTGALAVGEGAYERGNRRGGFALRIFHGITPETEDTCHYFWSGAHGYRQSEPAVTDTLFAALSATFAEDAAILEAQHASLRACPAPLFNTVHDRARVIAERALEKLFAAE